MYSVCGTWRYIQVRVFEEISYFPYQWTVICECYTFFGLLIVVVGSFFLTNSFFFRF